MKDLLERRGDTIALAAGVLIAIILILTFTFSITSIAEDLRNSVDPNKVAPPAPVYDLKAAEQLNLRGLTPGR